MSLLHPDRRDRPAFQVKVDENRSLRSTRRSTATGPHGVSLEDLVHSERCSTLDFDRSSQLSTQELVIRKDVRWEVTREIARKELGVGFQ